MANFKSVELEKEFGQSTHEVNINCDGIKYIIGPTSDRKGLNITKIDQNNLDDNIIISAQSPNKIRIR